MPTCSQAVRPVSALICSILCALLLPAISGCGSSVPPTEEISADSSGPIEELPDAEFSDQDWPWWRGPHRNGTAEDQPVPTSWSATENVVWKVPLPGRGHSSPTIVADRIYLATADEAEQVQSVLALSRETGDPVWQTEINRGGFPPSNQMHANNTHATCTLACDGQRLLGAFLHHGKITAVALNLDGTIAWKQELGSFEPNFGYAPSPVVYKSFVIFAGDHRAGGFLAAVHRRSGKIHWRKRRPDVATYASPVVANVAGKDQLLISGNQEVTSYDPLTGEQLWNVTGTADSACGTMVWDGDLVFASGGHPQKETVAVRADGSGEVVWRSKFHSYEPSLLAHDGHIYAVTNNGIAVCWAAATGKELWKQRLRGKFSSSPVLVGRYIFVTNETGKTYVFQADPARYTAVAENQLGDECFATLAACGQRLYLRVAANESQGRQEYLYCLGE